MFFIQTYTKHKKYKKFVKSVKALEITEHMDFETLCKFYEGVYSLINDYQDIFSGLSENLSVKEKIEVVSHLKNLMVAYTDVIKNLNETLMSVLKNQNISVETHENTVAFAEKSIAISETTVSIIEKLANLIR